MFRHTTTVDQSVCNTRSVKNSQTESAPPLSFEIARGSTRYPVRPIRTDRFLIGSGRFCDLRLGGEGIPVIHSVIRHDGEEAWIDVLVPSPPLVVNGEIEHSATISDGDQIRIGCFEFYVQKPTIQSDAKQQRQTEDGQDIANILKNELVEQPKPQELSAAELVEKLEQEHELVDRYEARREMGARALLQAISERAARLSEADSSYDLSEGKILPQIESVLQELDRFHASLQERSEMLEQREISCAEAASTLLEVQQRMADMFESMVKQIAILPDGRSQSAQKIA